ncbi:MAG: hypothetical protein U1E56_08915 [Bauldia sp.]
MTNADNRDNNLGRQDQSPSKGTQMDPSKTQSGGASGENRKDHQSGTADKMRQSGTDLKQSGSDKGKSDSDLDKGTGGRGSIREEDKGRMPSGGTR